MPYECFDLTCSSLRSNASLMSLTDSLGDENLAEAGATPWRILSDIPASPLGVSRDVESACVPDSGASSLEVVGTPLLAFSFGEGLWGLTVASLSCETLGCGDGWRRSAGGVEAYMLEVELLELLLGGGGRGGVVFTAFSRLLKLPDELLD